MNSNRILLILAVILILSPAAAFGDNDHSAGAVYVMNNEPDGNAIVAFDRDFRGRLTPAGSYPTEGLGTGGAIDPLASQGSLIISRNKRWLLAVNAGSNDISVFRVGRRHLKLTDNYDSGGTYPTSLTLFHNVLYVLNAGANGNSPNITGFRLTRHGSLIPIADSTQPLTGGGFHQIGFTPHGDALVVTRGGGNAASEILVFAVDEDGKAEGEPSITPSSGAVPFGFFFDWRGHLLVSEAGAGAVSTYELLDDNTLSVISASVGNGNAATCWIAGTWFGAVFTANTASNTISAYKIRARDGSIRLTEADAGLGVGPIDMTTTSSGRFLYVLNANDGTVSAFRILPHGGLTSLGAAGELPVPYAQGIAVR